MIPLRLCFVEMESSGIDQECVQPRALPAETKVESGTSQSKIGTSVKVQTTIFYGVGRDARLLSTVHCPSNMAHIRQSRPHSGLGFHLKFVDPPKLFPLRSAAAVLSHRMYL